MATLDILVPHFNDLDGLALSLKSVSDQTWMGDVRIVVADDGSRDDVRLLLDDIVQRSGLGLVEIVYNKTNRGRPYTRNVLLDAIESPYVAWLDAGDEWYPRKLEVQFDALALERSQNPEGHYWVTCNYDWAWLGGRKRKRIQRTEQDQVRALLMGTSLRAYLWTLLAPAGAYKDIGWFDERLPRLQDLDFFIRFTIRGGRIKNVQADDPLCVYHKSDIGRNAQEIRQCNALIFDKHRVLYNRYGENFKRMQLYKMEMLAARFAQNNHESEMARRYMWEAFKTRPTSFLKHVWKYGLKA